MSDIPITNTEFAILGLLTEGASHGYEIEQTIENRGMRDWTEIGFSSIYFVLGKLEKKGLIKSEKPTSSKSRKTFTVTSQGYRLHASRTYEAIAEPHSVHPSILLGLANWPGLEPKQAIDALKSRLGFLRGSLETVKAKKIQQKPMPDFVEIQFDYSISQIEAEIKWAEHSIAKMVSAMPNKVDFKKTLKSLYAPSSKEFSLVEVPEMKFIMIDGAGVPGNAAYANALSWLYPLSYGLKFHSKKVLGKDYVVPPLEGLWWAKDMTAYTAGRKEDWLWTLMIMQPDWITNEIFSEVLKGTIAKKGTPPETLRFETYDEGLSVQIMHIGPYSEEGPTLERMHHKFIPENGLVWTGHHHEIYIGDPRKSAPETLKTILRQPVRKR